MTKCLVFAIESIGWRRSRAHQVRLVVPPAPCDYEKLFEVYGLIRPDRANQPRAHVLTPQRLPVGRTRPAQSLLANLR